MNVKTSKTILFASLIAAMILPFGSMQVADATTETITDLQHMSYGYLTTHRH